MVAASRGSSSFSEGARRGQTQRSLGGTNFVRRWESQKRSNIRLGPLIQGPWPICTAQLNSAPQVQSLAGVAHPALLLHPRAAGGDKQCRLVMLAAAVVVVEWHLSRPPSA